MSSLASVDLPDLNVWFALSVPSHPHYARAMGYWQAECSGRVAFCSHTVLGLARLLSNVKVMGGDPLTPQSAWETCRTWLGDSRVIFAAEPRRCHITLDGYVVGSHVRPKTWPDAYLAAFASSGRMRLVSFDSDFSDFPNLQWLHLVE